MHSYTENSALFCRLNHPSKGVDQPAYITAYHPRQLGRLLNRLGIDLTHWLTMGTLPHVSKTMQGEVEFWRVYDPISNQTRYFDHENDLRAWMEQRYYQ